MSRKLKKRRKPISRTSFNVKQKTQEALALHRQGQLDEAAVIYKTILKLQPKHGDVHNLLGTIHIQTKNFKQAVILLKKAIKLSPDQPGIHSNLGTAQKELGKLPEAVSSFNKALSIKPDHFESLYNLANVYQTMQQFENAADTFKKILQLKPRMVDALLGQMGCYLAQDKLAKAMTCADTIQEVEPNNTNIYCSIGSALQDFRKFEESLSVYKRALQVMPQEGIIHNNIGNSLVKLDRLHEALSSYQLATELSPDLTVAYINLAWTFREHGMLTESYDCFQKLKEKKELSPLDHSDLLFSMNYDPSFNNRELLNAAEEWWELHCKTENMKFNHSDRNHLHKKRLRVGFVSPDFSNHPVGFFLTPLFQKIDKAAIELFCYAQMSQNYSDKVTESLKNLSDHWVYISAMSDEAVAKKIYADKIDILIDLAGHTADNRLVVFTMKPAPVQVNWLGYVNTTGLANIDYRITDSIVDPESDETCASENIYRMPNGFFCYTPHSNSPECTKNPPIIKNSFITFGSLNNLPKITPEVISLWSKILHKVPNSQFLFVSSQFKDPAIIRRHRDLFEQFGINSSRIEFQGKLSVNEYLNKISEIDIALDPFPHNGHTITCDTLWMGVPVITLRGDRYASRMTASALSLIALKELIAESKDEYIKKAVNLAENVKRLGQLRLEIRDRIKNSTMYDQQQFAVDFQNALFEMWEQRSTTNKNP